MTRTAIAFTVISALFLLLAVALLLMGFVDLGPEELAARHRAR